MTALMVALGAGVGFGILLVLSGLRGIAADVPAARRTPHSLDGLHRRVGMALAGAAAAGLLSRWPVAVIGGALFGACVPGILGGKANRDRAIDRSDAIAAWAELLRDSLSGAHGIEEVIVTTAPIAPGAIRDDVLLLATRVGHERLPAALRQLADDLADPTADLVVAALVIAAEGSSRELGELLGTLAVAARDEATMRRRVEASRARARSTMQMVTGLTAAMVVGLLLFDRSYLSPYDDALGQLVLALVAGLFAFALWWLARMARIPAPDRFLTVGPSEGATR
jgi:tight adherence protein B